MKEGLRSRSKSLDQIHTLVLSEELFKRNSNPSATFRGEDIIDDTQLRNASKIEVADVAEDSDLLESPTKQDQSDDVIAGFDFLEAKENSKKA